MLLDMKAYRRLSNLLTWLLSSSMLLSVELRLRLSKVLHNKFYQSSFFTLRNLKISKKSMSSMKWSDKKSLPLIRKPKRRAKKIFSYSQYLKNLNPLISRTVEMPLITQNLLKVETHWNPLSQVTLPSLANLIALRNQATPRSQKTQTNSRLVNEYERTKS